MCCIRCDTRAGGGSVVEWAGHSGAMHVCVKKRVCICEQEHVCVKRRVEFVVTYMDNQILSRLSRRPLMVCSLIIFAREAFAGVCIALEIARQNRAKMYVLDT